MAYSATMIETPIALWWQLTIDKFETIIKHISGVDNKYQMLRRIPSATNYQVKPSTQGKNVSHTGYSQIVRNKPLEKVYHYISSSTEIT